MLVVRRLASAVIHLRQLAAASRSAKVLWCACVEGKEVLLCARGEGGCKWKSSLQMRGVAEEKDPGTATGQDHCQSTKFKLWYIPSFWEECLCTPSGSANSPNAAEAAGGERLAAGNRALAILLHVFLQNVLRISRVS